MVLVVLFTLLLLAGILAATLRLGLSSRQNTADQAATLQAQYAAESGMALAQSRLRDLENMLSAPQAGSNIGLKLARNIRFSAVRSWVNLLCGSGTWRNINEGKGGNAGFYDKGADKSYPQAQECVPSDLNSDDNFTLLAKIVTSDAYDLLPTGERPAADEASRKAFWRGVFTTSKTLNTSALGASATTQLTLTRILRLSSIYHRVYLKVPQLTANASGGSTGATARRVLTAQSAKDGEWWFDIVQPSLLDAVVQTDYHTAMGGDWINFTTGTRFQGPLKTNDVFTFTSRNGFNSPSFSGQIVSAGCTNRTVTADEITCNRNPGVRIGDDETRNFSGTDAQKSTRIKNYIQNQGVNVNYNGITPNFAGQYQPFPTIVENQENAANGKDDNGTPFNDGSRGLVLGSDEIGVQMFVGDNNMNPPSTYDTTNRKWQEASSSYQYFRPITATNCSEQLGGTCNPIYSNTIYRVDKDMNMYSKTGTGTWTTMSGKFNGVLFKGGGSATPLTLMGPTRTSGSTPEAQARPAVASFMGITLATPREIDVRSDLALSQSPCRYDEYETVQVQPPCKERENVLGLFSSAQKIVIKKQVPNNAVLQAAMMSSQQEFTVEDHNDGDPRGDIIFTGSLVEKYYGANGTFGTERYCARQALWGCAEYATRTVRTGYTRDYSHDKRFLDGLTPPFYPTSPKWDFTDASRDGNDLTSLIRKQGS